MLDWILQLNREQAIGLIFVLFLLGSFIYALVDRLAPKREPRMKMRKK